MVLLAYHLFEEFYIKEMLGIALGCLCMKSNIWLIDYVFWSFLVWAFIKPKESMLLFGSYFWVEDIFIVIKCALHQHT